MQTMISWIWKDYYLLTCSLTKCFGSRPTTYKQNITLKLIWIDFMLQTFESMKYNIIIVTMLDKITMLNKNQLHLIFVIIF